jgi:hypothetical protein
MKAISGSLTARRVGSATSAPLGPLASLGRPTGQGWGPTIRTPGGPRDPIDLGAPIRAMDPEGWRGEDRTRTAPEVGMGPTRECDSFMGPNTLEETSARYASLARGFTGKFESRSVRIAAKKCRGEALSGFLQSRCILGPLLDQSLDSARAGLRGCSSALRPM